MRDTMRRVLGYSLRPLAKTRMQRGPMGIGGWFVDLRCEQQALPFIPFGQYCIELYAFIIVIHRGPRGVRAVGRTDIGGKQ